ncbi:MAG: HD domain-containing protein [Planctomycetes bacterium]|nr:HD domain-containing protein [Planctomycetota bacterium]
MSHSDTHLDAKLAHQLRQRLRQVGLLLLDCDKAGGLISRPQPGADWLADLFCQAAIFTSAVRQAAAAWSQQSTPMPVELFPGCWLSPIPRTNRRRRTGYALAVILTERFLDCEQLSAMCQAGRADFEVIRRMLADLPPVGPSDVGRTAAMVSHAIEDHWKRISDSQAMESVGQQLAESYEEINLLYTIIQSMSVVDQPERFVTIACEELLATLPYAWIGAQLADDRETLKKLAGRLIIAGDPGQPESQLRELTCSILAEVKADAPMVLEPATNPRHAKYAQLGKSVLVHPVSRDGKVIGLLIAGEKQGPDTTASNVDLKLLGATASHMGIFLENAALYDDLNAMFLGTLEALTASIDAKDTYTCGHSQRVAHLTQQLAQAMGLDEHTVRRMHIAGVVHDVGKIGVPESVLTKPGRLTEEEFAWMRQHPEIGHRILKDIPQLRDILPGVLYHHERWDGKGYPEGLCGDRIPKVARMIALADAFDAMSSTRTYRPALSRAEVLQEIMECAGTQFDPEFAPVFVRIDFSGYDRLFVEHRAGEQKASQDEEQAA